MTMAGLNRVDSPANTAPLTVAERAAVANYKRQTDHLMAGGHQWKPVGEQFACRCGAIVGRYIACDGEFHRTVSAPSSLPPVIRQQGRTLILIGQRPDLASRPEVPSGTDLCGPECAGYTGQMIPLVDDAQAVLIAGAINRSDPWSTIAFDGRGNYASGHALCVDYRWLVWVGRDGHEPITPDEVQAAFLAHRASWR